MFKKTVLAAALAAALATPVGGLAADDRDLTQIREQIRQIKQDYETRIQALEKRLQEAEAKMESAPAPTQPAATTASASSANAAATNAFNPAMSLILGGTYANLSQDPNQYRIQGFIPGGEDNGPGKRNFSLGESELTFSANVDHLFAGQLTFSVASDNSVSVEEAFFRAPGLAHGVNLMGGRFLSAVGYLNSQHAHAWDFVDAPLAYRAFFGGQYKTDGVQLKWLAPTDQFLEFGLEAGQGAAFPGNDRNKNGLASAAAFAHWGDDIGDSSSWRLGLSYLHNGATARSYGDVDRTGTSVTNAFTGNSGTWIADGIYKWAPHGNATQTNLKLQAEYFRRNERGTLAYDTLAQSLGTMQGSYDTAQSGWYAQSVYQFMPMWRVGLRFDQLYSGTPRIGLVDSGALAAADFPRLAAYNPSRTSVMFDYSPSEFSRLRLQVGQDKSRPQATDNEIFLQYIMSLGVHGAHTF
jgi:hypothetical protein